MNFCSRAYQPKDSNLSASRQEYGSNSIVKSSVSNQRLEQIRRKYDTPTRKQLKQIQIKPPLQKPTHPVLDIQLRKSINVSTNSDMYTQKWNHKQSNITKDYEMSPGYRKQNIKNEEQMVFRKIREMKDSLLSKNNDKIKTTKSIYQPRFSEKLDNKHTALGQHRVENIDKINTKIQQILSCLKQTQSKGASTYENSYNKYDLKDSSKMTVDSKNYSRTRMTQDIKNTPDNRAEIKGTTSIYQQQKKYQISTPATKTVQNFQLNSGRKQNSKARSFISSIQKQVYNGSKYEMRSGKKLDDQIHKIQSKIQQFEQQKRKLNIDFKPYSYSNSKSSANLIARSHTIDKYSRPTNRTQTQSNDQQKKVQESIISRRERLGDRFTQRMSQRPFSNKLPVQTLKKSIQQVKINVQLSRNNQKQSQRSNFDSQQGSLFKIKLIPIESVQPSTSNSRVQCKVLSDQLRKKTDSGILDRKKRLVSQISNKPRPTVKKLVDLLSSQAKLDEQLRNNKLCFESNMDLNKWQKLQQQLGKKGIKMNQQKLRQTFKVTDQQNNPFFSVKQAQGSIQTLASSYVQSEKHWKNQIIKNLPQKDLLNQEFTSDLLDLQKKGYIVLQDIVRFLNMETGTFYRNRDIFLIFRRVSLEQKIKFSCLLDILCK